MPWVPLLVLLHCVLLAHGDSTDCNGAILFDQGTCQTNNALKCCGEVEVQCAELDSSGEATGYKFTAYKDNGQCCCCNSDKTHGYPTINDNQLCAFNNGPPGPKGNTIYQSWWSVDGSGYCQILKSGSSYTQISSSSDGCSSTSGDPRLCDQSYKWCYDAAEVHWPSSSPSPSPSPSVKASSPSPSPSVKAPSPSSSPRITGDPHYLGFDGTSYDFTGFAGGFFNMYSDPAHQVNMLFDNFGMKGLTFIKELGIKYGTAVFIVIKSQLLTDGNGAALEVLVNNKSVPLEADSENDFTVGDVQLKMVHQELGRYTINVTTPTIMVQVIKVQKSNLHLDVSLSFVNAPANHEDVHGSLGQSLRWVAAAGEGAFEGDETDYLVSGLFADDFTFNKFRGEHL